MPKSVPQFNDKINPLSLPEQNAQRIQQIASAIAQNATPTFAGLTLTGRLIINYENDVDLSGITGSLIIGGTGSAQHIAIDQNEIQSKSNGTTASILNLNNLGGQVAIGSGGLSISGNLDLHTNNLIVDSGGDKTLTPAIFSYLKDVYDTGVTANELDKLDGYTGDVDDLNKIIEAGRSQGDMLYASADNVLAWLTKGNDNDILRMNGNVPNWEVMPSFLLNVLEDTTPQLGGNLDVNGKDITSPDGTDLIDIVNGSIDIQTASSSRLDITDSGVRLGGANARVTTIIDDDSMATATATVISTSESIKSYVDDLIIINPIGFGYDQGFASWAGGLGCSVLHNDDDARVFFSWIVPQTRTDWKITLITLSGSPRTASGIIYVGATADGEAMDTNSIFNGVNFDCLSGGGANFFEYTSTSAFSATRGDYLYMRWEKDTADGLGTFYVAGAYLSI